MNIQDGIAHPAITMDESAELARVYRGLHFANCFHTSLMQLVYFNIDYVPALLYAFSLQH